MLTSNLIFPSAKFPLPEAIILSSLSIILSSLNSNLIGVLHPNTCLLTVPLYSGRIFKRVGEHVIGHGHCPFFHTNGTFKEVQEIVGISFSVIGSNMRRQEKINEVQMKALADFEDQFENFSGLLAPLPEDLKQLLCGHLSRTPRHHCQYCDGGVNIPMTEG
ncbi:hypothetical protein Tco_0543329 [Tanacetum coccineum]